MGQSLPVIGIDLGGTKINAGLVTPQGDVLSRRRVPTPVRDGGEAILNALIAVARELEAEAQGPVGAIGIGSPGHVDWVSGQVDYCTPNMPGWSGRPLRQQMESACHLPTVLDNDANAAVYGETWLGAGQGLEHVVMLTLGTGLGGGIISHGQLIRGHRGAGAELGHIVIQCDGRRCNCGQIGCLEEYVCGTALARMAREAMEGGQSPRLVQLAQGQSPNGFHLFQAAQEGDPGANQALDQFVHYLAVGIISVINIFGPQALLIGGGVSEQGQPFLDRIRAAVQSHYSAGAPLDPHLVRLAALGEDAGLLGAAGLALHHAPARL